MYQLVVLLPQQMDLQVVLEPQLRLQQWVIKYSSVLLVLVLQALHYSKSLPEYFYLISTSFNGGFLLYQWTLPKLSIDFPEPL